MWGNPKTLFAQVRDSLDPHRHLGTPMHLGRCAYAGTVASARPVDKHRLSQQPLPACNSGASQSEGAVMSIRGKSSHSPLGATYT
eukprot:3624691-Amphidinium_carterae.1